MKWRQRSRLTRIRFGDANTKLFHLRANGRRRKNHIPALQGPLGKVYDHKQKAKLILEHFKGTMGTSSQRNFSLNWDYLQLPTFDLDHLEGAFTMEEMKEAVFGLHAEKAPGPEGFIGGFFKKCWHLVKDDLLKAINQLHCLKGDNCKLLNAANIVLLPKKEDADFASDFRPVSLMHSVAKIVCKILANDLPRNFRR